MGKHNQMHPPLVPFGTRTRLVRAEPVAVTWHRWPELGEGGGNASHERNIIVRVLVTGCAGFIGARVTERLLADGHEVVGADVLNDAYDPRLKHWRLDQLHGADGFSFHTLDIADRDALLPLFADGFDAVVNLAARAGVRASVADPWAYYATNVTGTLNLLDLCRANGVGKFVQASTSSVYGDGPRPFHEDGVTDRPRSPYAASKKAAELLCYTYHLLHGLDITIPRYFTVYGPASRPDMAMFRFVRWIAEGEPLVLFGDGTQERDFTHVDDIARGTIAALKPVGFAAVNLGSDNPVPLTTVISGLEGLLERDAVIEHRPVDASDVAATWADIGRAKELLGWEPSVSLDDGLRSCVEWYREHHDLARSISLS